MDEDAEHDAWLLEQARAALEYRIRPQEEVTELRRLQAHHLSQSLGTEQLNSPLSLIDADAEITPSDVLQASAREFAEAALKNVEFRQKWTKIREAQLAAMPPPAPTPAEDKAKVEAEAKLLELQLEVNALEEERDRLLAIEKHLVELEKMPAASPDFLDPEVMYKDCPPLPELPKELMEGFTQDRTAPDQEIQELLSRLRKEDLRQKLILQRDKRKLAELKAKYPIDPRNLPPEVQLHALNAVKDTLINWIETMLSKAGEDGAESEAGSPSKQRQTEREKFDSEAQLADIQKEFVRHLELRKEVMTAMAQLRQISINDNPLPEVVEPEKKPLPSKPDPQAFLLTPYLEQLQAISREQKGLIQEKSHINATLAKQQQDTNKVLDRLVDESQLLPKYPAAKPGDKSNKTSSSSFSEATKGASVTDQVQPWLFASDSAKLATLEAVAEQVEEGQMAIDDAMEALDHVRKLLGKEAAQPPQAQTNEGPAESDLWLADEERKVGGAPARKNTEKEPEREEKSIWAKLDGNLGLINGG
ncbi:Uu.00g046260.m01.CDS01 [Anthostomella pinea]|uniref:Uu.00g046260.m01.CDS01 n=1 Tax=Anthostomella pinea TaxID=933095 RepID=A0AAI8V697_9PEZI|nr:Uu.00g046260.m01.CDS01 [Anthostomella pinea]